MADDDGEPAVVAMPEAAWQAVQRRAFTAWMNQYLGKKGVTLRDPVQDLDNGVLLNTFLELILDKELKLRLDLAPKTRIKAIDNLNQVLGYIGKQMDLKLVNVSAEDFADHNAKIILGVIYLLYKKLMIKTIASGGKTAEEALMLWVREKTRPYGIKIESYKTSFDDGRAFLALVDDYVEDKSKFDFAKAAGPDARANLEKAFSSAQTLMGVPRVLEPQDFGEGVTDERGVIIALSTYFHAFKLGEKERENARKMRLLQKQLDEQNKHMESSAAELDRLRRELEEQKARVQPADVWNAYRNNMSAHAPPDFSIPFSVEENVLGTKFTSYHIRVACADKVWAVKRRYSDFDKLVEKMSRELKRQIVSPKLPPKRMVGNLDLEFVNSRREALEAFLRDVIRSHADLARSDAFADFVSRDTIKQLIDTPTFKKREREKLDKVFKSQAASLGGSAGAAAEEAAEDD